VNHLRLESVRVAASSDASLQKLYTWFTSTAAALNHPYVSGRTFNLSVRVNEDVISVLLLSLALALHFVRNSLVARNLHVSHSTLAASETTLKGEPIFSQVVGPQ
jgi:hypothetical protein